MKKIALVLAVLLVIGGAAFAEITVGGDATVSGSESITIGADLDNGVWGADQSTSITVKVPFVNGSAGAAGDDAMYGEISLSDVGVNWNKDEFEDADYDGTDYFGSIAAKIVAGDISVLLNNGGVNFNNAAGSGDYNVNLDDDWYAPSVADLTVGFDNGMISVSAIVAAKSGLTRFSAGDANEDFEGAWDGETASSDDTASTQADPGVMFAFNAGFTMDMFSIPVTVVSDPYYAPNQSIFAFTATPSVSVGPATVDIPVDYVNFVSWINAAQNDYGFDIAPAVSVAIIDGLSASADAYIYNHHNDLYYVNAGVGVSVGAALVPGLTASVDFDLTDIWNSEAYNVDGAAPAANLGWGLDVSATYEVLDGLSVTLSPGIDSTNDLDFAGSVVAGPALTTIDNTTFELSWSSVTKRFDAADATDDEKYINYMENCDAGILSLATTISF